VVKIVPETDPWSGFAADIQTYSIDPMGTGELWSLVSLAGEGRRLCSGGTVRDAPGELGSPGMREGDCGGGGDSF
jgi:hypothetical protein